MPHDPRSTEKSALQISFLRLQAPVSRNRYVYVYVPDGFNLEEMTRLQDYLTAWTQALAVIETKEVPND